MIVYTPLWQTMKDKDFTTYTLRAKHNVGGSTIQRLKKNMPVSTYTLNMLCTILDCAVSDIAEYIPDAPNHKEK